MATKADFTLDEWNLMLGSVMLAGMAVTLADPSGLIGMTQEGIASGSALVAAKADPQANPLVKAVVADFETSDGRAAARAQIKATFADQKQPPAMKAAVLAALEKAGAVVDAKAPADAPGFKAWLVSISDRVANAASEGGFLGFGGVRVSDAEKATLADISKALKA